MLLKDLKFDYPEELIGLKPEVNFRTLVSEAGGLSELTKKELLDQFNEGDVLVVNETKVLKRRLFSAEGFEVLFLEKLSPNTWKTLFPASRLKKGKTLSFPEGVELSLVERGLPQVVELNIDIDEAYFAKFGEMALPPYIQKARGERNMQAEDEQWYQTEWAKDAGSCAAPTASLHFTNEDLEYLKSERGVQVVPVILHVGLGTFSPIRVDDLNDHDMHHEYGFISAGACKAIDEAKLHGFKVWALGTTVTRTLESWGKDKLSEDEDGNLSGLTNLFIQPGFEFSKVDILMTNFHQPESSLLALVSGFAGYENVMSAYRWAIDQKFKLFSYGDLSVWKK